MQRPIYLSLVFHNHQPVGNFDFVFEEAYAMAYRPLVECLERHPKVHVGMHFSGCLRDWLQVHQPDLFVKLKALVKRGQVEILTGAYYEPILTNLSDEDKIGQIQKQTKAIEDDFEYRPEGMWVAERVWEPHLIKPIAQTGVKYVIVDDTHFEYVGFKTDELLGYFVSEEQGYPLNIFPTLTKLRYIIPWAEVDKAIEWLRQQAQAQQPEYHYPKLAFMGDDGEKFGLWPGTYEQCWGNSKYMDRLFQAFEANSDWLITVSPREYMNQYPARGRAYLPTASYMEMSEWALPPDDSWELTSLRHRLEQRRDHEANPAQREELSRLLRYLRGGFWRNFLVKYPEINHMQKRAMWLSERVHALPEGQRKTEALEHLWAAQCNCAYWHGVFGGIYLFHIRAANYANLIAAEELVDQGQKLTLRKFDFDLDGNDEILITSSPFSLIFDFREMPEENTVYRIIDDSHIRYEFRGSKT
ncbi:MAG: DUF1925 domain-containing protein, partial [candidate division KSB1 bacterium]|nr:DUF1925 domain-containing protein [candidate division KSB1 bacterium]